MIGALRNRIAPVLLPLLIGACDGPDLSALQSDPAAPASAVSARTIFSDRTMLTYGPHGTQIEYHRPDGRAFLWYLGNLRAVPSNWRTEGGADPDICWQYPDSSYNPLTRTNGGRWECTDIGYYAYDLEEVLQGDPFGLSDGSIPFRLSRGRFTAANLMQRAGRDPADLRVLLIP